jgi:hypothetical protein
MQIILFINILFLSQVLEAHTCNPNYSGGRDQENHGSKPVQANSSGDPVLKKHVTKRAGGIAQVVVYLSSKCEALSSNRSTTKIFCSF